jgi:hypothetical protein
MYKKKRVSPLLRATGIIGVVAALVTGVTYAALQSQATLTDNTISSGTASLLINNTENATAEGATDTGFNFTGVIPGGASSNSHNFTLHNTGTTPLKINVGMPALPTWTVTPSGSVDNTKVTLNITCTGPSLTLNTTVQTAWFSTAPMTGTLGAGETASCTANVSMDAAAFTGSNAASSNFNLIFTGTAAVAS